MFFVVLQFAKQKIPATTKTPKPFQNRRNRSSTPMQSNSDNQYQPALIAVPAQPTGPIVTQFVVPEFFIPGMVDSSMLATLVARAPDKEMLLALKLPFHHRIAASELAHMQVGDFGFGEARVPHEIRAGWWIRGSMYRRRIVIEPADGRVLQALLPSSGPLFSEKDPFRRAQHFAKRLGIWLTRAGAADSLQLHEFALGIQAYARARPPQAPRPYCPITPKQAEAYWRVPFDRRRIASLPRHS